MGGNSRVVRKVGELSGACENWVFKLKNLKEPLGTRVGKRVGRKN